VVGGNERAKAQFFFCAVRLFQKTLLSLALSVSDFYTMGCAFKDNIAAPQADLDRLAVVHSVALLLGIDEGVHLAEEGMALA
jgi:hypothetical protein